jgi:hypothetical protein
MVMMAAWILNHGAAPMTDAYAYAMTTEAIVEGIVCVVACVCALVKVWSLREV